MDIIFDNFLQYKAYAGGTVVVKYWALVNNSAIIGNPGNPNEVNLTYSRNPNVEGTPDTDEPNNPTKDTTAVTGTTPWKRVRTYITELELLKKDADTQKPLTGAKFKITGTRYIPAITTESVYETDANGTWYLLTDGTYTDVAPTIDTYEYDPNDSSIVTKVITGNYSSYAGYDGTTVYGYETVTALSYAGDYADAAEAAAALANAIKPTHKRTIKVTLSYKTELVDTEIEVDADGRLLLGGLGAGDYILEETVAPAGYNLLAKKIELQIRFATNNDGENDPNADKFTAQWRFEGDAAWTPLNAQTKAITVEYNQVGQEIDDNYFQLKVDNKKGATVPETGGIGTTLFYVFGGIFVIAAGVLMIVRRRLSAVKVTE
jgi:LPXTG-motif cell wall-anchored protein